MARFPSDENFPLPVVLQLRRLGHDVLTAHEASRANVGIPDDGVLIFATAHGRAVLTLNRWRFVPLHGRVPAHAGIVVCTYDADYVGQAGRIAAAVAGLPSLAGLLIRVNPRA